MDHIKRKRQLQELVSLLLATVERIDVVCASRRPDKLDQAAQDSVCVWGRLALESCHGRRHGGAKHAKTHCADIKRIGILIQKIDCQP